MRLKARLTMCESRTLKPTLRRTRGANWSEGVLVSLFRDLGADRPVEGSMTIPEAAAMHFEPLSADDSNMQTATEEEGGYAGRPMRSGTHARQD